MSEWRESYIRAYEQHRATRSPTGQRYLTCPHGRGWGACGECREEDAEHRRKVEELEELERSDTLSDEPVDASGLLLCSHCRRNSREVRDLCGQCWRLYVASEHELRRMMAHERADDD